MANNKVFICVYKLPPKLTNGYCFETEVPITFLNVDWFEMIAPEKREVLIEFIKRKRYFDTASKFLVLSDHPDFTFTL